MITIRGLGTMSITNRVNNLYGNVSKYAKQAAYGFALLGASLISCGPGTDASLEVKGNKVYVEINREGIDLSGAHAKGKVKNPKAYLALQKTDAANKVPKDEYPSADIDASDAKNSKFKASYPIAEFKGGDIAIASELAGLLDANSKKIDFSTIYDINGDGLSDVSNDFSVELSDTPQNIFADIKKRIAAGESIESVIAGYAAANSFVVNNLLAINDANGLIDDPNTPIKPYINANTDSKAYTSDGIVRTNISGCADSSIEVAVRFLLNGNVHYNSMLDDIRLNLPSQSCFENAVLEVAASKILDGNVDGNDVYSGAAGGASGRFANAGGVAGKDDGLQDRYLESDAILLGLQQQDITRNKWQNGQHDFTKDGLLGEQRGFTNLGQRDITDNGATGFYLENRFARAREGDLGGFNAPARQAASDNTYDPLLVDSSGNPILGLDAIVIAGSGSGSGTTTGSGTGSTGTGTTTGTDGTSTGTTTGSGTDTTTGTGTDSTTTQQCPTACPADELSACVNGTQDSKKYTCSDLTNFLCTATITAQSCTIDCPLPAPSASEWSACYDADPLKTTGSQTRTNYSCNKLTGEYTSFSEGQSCNMDKMTYSKSNGVFRSNLDFSQNVQISLPTNITSADHPRLSSNLIYFIGAESGAADVYKYNLDTAQATNVTNSSGAETDVDVDSDGKVVFTRSSELWMSDSLGTNFSKIILPATLTYVDKPRKKSNLIYFIGAESGAADVYKYNLDTAQATNVTNSSGAETDVNTN